MIPADGLVLIDKSQSLTSQQVVSRVKKQLGVKKAGHGGTLDPMATGLLVLGLGRGTRLLGYLAGQDKRYQATIRLGQATNTDDAEGEPLGDAVDATGLSEDEIIAAMKAYVGVIEQVPCSVSAIKVDGKRSYALVRQGQRVDLKSRTVTVHGFELNQRLDNSPWVDLNVGVQCSSGTYVRALARDLGKDLGVGAHLTALRRTQIGKLDVNQAVSLEKVSHTDVQDLATMALLVAPGVEVDAEMARQVSFGASIEMDLPFEMAAIFYKSQILGLYRPDPGRPGWARSTVVLVDSISAVRPDTMTDLIMDEGTT